MRAPHSLTRPPGRAAGRLNIREALWHLNWRGQVAVVRSVDEALWAVGVTG